LIVPMLCVGMQLQTLCVWIGMHRVVSNKDAERPRQRSHAERGNDSDLGGVHPENR